MSDPKDKTDTLDDLKARAELAAAEAAARSAANAAVEGLSRAGHGLLDALEVAVFGRVGGAEAQVAAEQQVDPLDRLRAKYEKVEAPKPAPRAEDPVAKAKTELERLKAEAAARKAGEQEPVKKTL